jgi:hypothetical protein
MGNNKNKKQKRKNKKNVEFNPWADDGTKSAEATDGTAILLPVCTAPSLSMEDI